MIVIDRPANGITLNGLEYVCDDNGEIMKFETCNHALKYLLLKTEPCMYGQIENEGIQFIYTNEHRECKCSQCECKFDCFMRGKVQRHPPETTNGLGLGLCPKLKKEWTKQWIKTN